MCKSSLSWVVVGSVAALSFALIYGCSGAGSAIGVVKNLGGEKSLIRVSLDGQEAKQNTLKKAVAGHSNWDIKDPVDSDNPKLSYKILKPEKMGRITATIVNLFQEFQGDYSTQSEFIVTPKDNAPENLMKENVVYELGKPPAGLRVLDVNGKDVPAVKLIPGKKYMLSLTIKADHSETLNIHFKTK